MANEMWEFFFFLKCPTNISQHWISKMKYDSSPFLHGVIKIKMHEETVYLS